eukprot:COSAG02_NODE_24835_length_676_cov_1.067591_1_plen_98_part_10
MLTPGEHSEWEVAVSRYDDSEGDETSCAKLIETIGQIEQYQTCSVARASANEGLIPEVLNTNNKDGQSCSEVDHACLFRMDPLDAVFQNAAIETEVRD